MKTIKYGDDAFQLRMDFPPTWNLHKQVPGAVTIAIYKASDGSELVAPTTARIPLGGMLASAVSDGDVAFTLTESPEGQIKGDPMRVLKSAMGPAETVFVEVVENTRIVLREPLRYDHGSGAMVNSLFATYNLNASDAATWVKGLEVRIVWDPNTDDDPYEEPAIVKVGTFELEGLAGDFQLEYPNEWTNIKDKFDHFARKAQRATANDLLARSSRVDIDRLINKDGLRDAIIARIACDANMAAGVDTRKEEIKLCWSIYERELANFAAISQWIDTDQDGKKDAGEEGPILQGPPLRNYS